MSAQAWTTVAVLVVVLGLLVRGRTSPAAVVFGGAVALLVLGVVTPEEAFSGFANPAPITVAALYVVAAGVERTGALTPAIRGVLGRTGRYRRPLLRVTVPTAAVSAFLNNTPIVAMLVPQVQSWSQHRGLSPSKFLMPVSFAAVLGGTITVIGTSTNLVVSGQMGRMGLEEIGFFEIGMLGLPLTVLGLVIMVALAPAVLPSRLSARQELQAAGRDYAVEMVVDPGGGADGRTVEQAGLRNLGGVFLAALDRGADTIAPVTPDTRLQGGDRLRFVGPVRRVVGLQQMPGLTSAERKHVVDLRDPMVRYFEVVVGTRSPMLGRSLKEIGFRSTYQAAVLGIHRSGELLQGPLGTETLRQGDTLMVVADEGWRARWMDKPDFLLIAGLDGAPPTVSTRACIPLATLVVMVVLAATGVLPILEGSLLGALVLVMTRVLTPLQARRAVDLEVIVVIAGSFGLAAAMESSGLAATLAGHLVDAFGGLGAWGVVLGVVLATMVLTELVTNNAAALLMLPIAVPSALAAGLDPRGLAIAVAVAASASFLTPIGYQTNMMVYGPGGYRFGDYARLGWALSLLVLATTVVLTPLLWPSP
jgi:di/tricarboxylate transporter